MALFKISKGSKANLPAELTEGFCWYTYDDSKFYIDHKDENGILVRKALNAQEAEKLTGYDVATILNASDIEVPTSKAVFEAIQPLATAINGLNSSNLLAKMSPKDIHFNYSTKSNGWRMHLNNPDGGSSTLYINDDAIDEKVSYKEVFTMNPMSNASCTVNIQKINDACEAGEFDFMGPALKRVVFYDTLDNSSAVGAYENRTIAFGGIGNNPCPSKNIPDNVYVGTDIPTSVSGTTRNAFLEYDVPFLEERLNADGEPVQYEYELTFSYCCMATGVSKVPAFDVVFPYYGVTILEAKYSHPDIYSDANPTYYLKTRTPSTARNQWIDVSIRFLYKGRTNPDTNPCTIGFRNYTSEVDHKDYCISNIVLKDVENHLPDFSDPIWERKDYYYPSTVTEDGILKTNKADLTEGPGYWTLCLLEALNTGSSLDSAGVWELSVEAIRRSVSYQWQDYMTLMEADKYALSNDNTELIDIPKIGGPWANALEENYSLQVSASKDNAWAFVNGIELHTSILSSSKSIVVLEKVKNGISSIISTTEFNENTDFLDGAPSHVKYIPCYIQNDDFDTLNIILSLAGEIRTDFNPKNNLLLGARIYGHANQTAQKDYPITIDYFGNIKSNGIKSNKYYGTWDDGSLSWRDL